MLGIKIKAYAKINLSLDVIKRYENGYHQVEMIMQQINIWDEVYIKYINDNTPFNIKLNSNKYFLPKDERNIAYKAALIMKEKYMPQCKGTVKIDILKRIPVAAGLAGGSSNAAAVIHGLNILWKLNLTLKELCEVGSMLGADVPFMIMGQAAANYNIPEYIKKDDLATTCAVATGIGTELTPLKSLKADIILSKPPIGVSTKEVYQGLDLENIKKHPNTYRLIENINKKNYQGMKEDIINVLEQYTLSAYPEVEETKKLLQKECPNSITVMSGSGPSVFTILLDNDNKQKAYKELRNINKETYLTRTLI